MGLLIWAIYGSVIIALVAFQPDRRTATIEYRKASTKWWQGQESLYQKKNGYLYFPHFAVLYSPYALLPSRVGEPLWRLTGLSLLAGALWLASTYLAREKANRLFFVATLLVLPSTFASARNGQVNLPLAGLFILMAIVLARERWWSAATLLGLMWVMKPIILAPLLVFAVLYPRLRVPLIGIILSLAGIIFVHFHPGYVADQYINFVANLKQASLPQGFSWCDFSGLLHVLHIHLPSVLQFAIRITAGLFTLLLSWRVMRMGPPLLHTLLTTWICVIYLMLFNPRTETNSYVMLGGFVALAAAYLGLAVQKWRIATGFACMAILLGVENYGNPIFPWTNLWLKPLLTLLLGVFLIWTLLSRPPLMQKT